MSSEADFDGIKITQKTNYPVNGKVEFSFENAKKVMIRIPAWCEEFKVNCDFVAKDRYIVIENPKDVVIEFVMKPVLMRASSNLASNIGKVALMYGPVVYCAESVDNVENLYSLYIDKNIDADVKYCDEYGLNKITVKGYKLKECECLYCSCEPEFEDIKINLIPYNCYANRGESNMLVWLKAL